MAGRSLLILLILFTVCTLSIAQVGLRTNYQSVRYNPWEYLTSNQAPQIAYSGNGYSFGVDYWFRLKDQRIEFFPEVNYSRQLALGINEKSHVLQSYALEFNTHFYFMDFFDDCDCPTWSKTNDWFQKGFFISVSPGVQYFQYPEINELISFNQIVGSLSLGTGVDIGFSDLITLTPFLKWRHFFVPEWTGLSSVVESNPNIDPSFESRYFNQIQVGLRLGFRFDQ
jgi:hypothetical protein